MRGKNGQTGIGIVEAFDLDPAAASRLTNISTRGFVEVDDNVMIAGLIVMPGEWSESQYPGPCARTDAERLWGARCTRQPDS